MTLEQYQSLSLDERLDYGISQALALMSTADAVIVTDEDGQHWAVEPADILPDGRDVEGDVQGFGEDQTPFDDD